MELPIIILRDRLEAGRELGKALQDLPRGNLMVVGLARGGIPVAYQVARALNAPMDVLSVRKLGAPQHPEFAIGAVATPGIEVLHYRSIDQLGVGAEVLEEVIAREKREELLELMSFRDLQRCADFLHTPGISVVDDARLAVHRLE